MRIRVALGIVIATMSSCGGGGATAEAGHRSSRPAVSTRPATPAPAPRAHKAPVRHASAPGLPRINRRQLVAVIDGGLGRFLQGVVTEPELAHGRFVGFRLQ